MSQRSVLLPGDDIVSVGCTCYINTVPSPKERVFFPTYVFSSAAEGVSIARISWNDTIL